MRSSTLGGIVLFVVLFPASLIMLKVIEVWVEPGSHGPVVSAHVKVGEGLSPAEEARIRQQMVESWSIADETGFGVVRRLDDAFFWALVALALGVRGIWIVCERADPETDRYLLAVPESSRSRFLLWLLCLVILALYIYGAYESKGTLFWLRQHAPWPWVRKCLVAALQILEGVGTVLAVASSYLFALLGCGQAARLATE